MNSGYRCFAIYLLAFASSLHAQSKPIAAPGQYVPQQALSFGARGGDATAVTASTPLPVEEKVSAATSTALAGTSTSAQSVGPFSPQIGRPIVVALSGSWSGTVQLLRSTDGGTTKLPLTPAGVTLGTYTSPGVDQPWIETEAGATFYLSLPATGISYRVAQ